MKPDLPRVHAIQWAVAFFRFNQDYIKGNDAALDEKQWLLYGGQILDEIFFYKLMRHTDPHPESELCRDADLRFTAMAKSSETSRAAFDALQKLRDTQLERQLPFPEPLRAWSDEVEAGIRKRPRQHGPNRYAHAGRNLYICWAVATLEQFGYTPTRNDVSEPDSACDIVSEALIEGMKRSLSYEAVKSIWKNRPEEPEQ